MIRSFSTLYAGHVLAGDGVGFHGTPAADRLLSFPIGATLSQFKEQLTYFAHEVMPAFKKTTVGVQVLLAVENYAIATLVLQTFRLLPWLYLSILSGAGLIGVELYSSCKWLYQGKGVLVLLKLLLIAAVAVFWEQRVWLLLAALVIGSVGSHMPGRFRYYSFIHRRVI